MRSDDIRGMSPSSLLITYASVLNLLRRHGVVRSFNSPVADITEWIVSKKLGLTLAPPSAKSFDAFDSDKVRYQIKGRWLAGHNRSTQLGAIRDLESSPFEFLVAVIFESDFFVAYAAVIPVAVVQQRSKFVARTNSYRFNFSRTTLTLPGVRDITTQLRVFPSTEEEERVLAALASVKLDGYDSGAM